MDDLVKACIKHPKAAQEIAAALRSIIPRLGPLDPAAMATEAHRYQLVHDDGSRRTCDILESAIEVASKAKEDSDG